MSKHKPKAWRLRHVAAYYLSLGALVGFGLRDLLGGKR